jgi:hypothetical protein
MRLEYRIELDKIEVPRFSVEAVEGAWISSSTV